jgi:hypothetical protein
MQEPVARKDRDVARDAGAGEEFGINRAIFIRENGRMTLRGIYFLFH